MYYEKDNCLVSVSNSILQHFGCETFHSTQPELDSILERNKGKKICLCLFDGMGKYIQELHSKYAKEILKKKRITITSVFPPTTVAATSALMSAKFPCETGWIGWTQKIDSCSHPVKMFESKDDITQEDVIPHTYETYKYKSIIERINESGKRAENVLSFELKETSLNSFFNVVEGKLQRNDFLYAYNTEPDASLHEGGTKSKKVSKLIEKIDRGMVKIAKDNPDTLFVVLADHGHIDTKYNLIDEHDDLYDCLKEKYNYLEPRSAVFFVKKNKKAEFEKLFRRYYGNHFKLYSRKEVQDLKIFGIGEPHPDFEKFLGDYLAVSESEYAIANSPDKMKMVSHHAGGTDKERYINISIFNDS